MKNSWYQKLWQAKRDELKVTGDVQKDWLEMQGILDKHLLLKPPTVNGHGKAPHITNFKLFTSLFITASAAAIIYYAVHNAKLKQHKHRRDSLIAMGKLNIKQDSISGFLRNDSLSVAKQSNMDKDSSDMPNEPGSKSGMKTGVSKNSLSSNSLSTDSVSMIDKNGNKPIEKENDNQKFSGAETGSGKKGDQTNRRFGGANPPATLRSRLSKKKNLFNYSFTYKGRYSTGKKNLIYQKFLNSGNNTADRKIAANSERENYLFMQPAPPGIYNSANISLSSYATTFVHTKLVVPDLSGSESNKNQKKFKSHSVSGSNLDWGILTGFNSSGSFTAKKQNANFYGSLPVDVYFGLFARYDFKPKWGIDIQLKVLSPQIITGSYTHANPSKIDSNQLLKLTDSRKTYAVSVPVAFTYKATKDLSVKAGPVFNFPVKQANGNSTLQPSEISKDSINYPLIISALGKTAYQQKISYGFSAGISYQYKRIMLEAAYLKNISGYKVNSGLGSYNSHAGTLQITVGFKLNKVKK